MDDRSFARFLIQEAVLTPGGLQKAQQIQEIFPARLDTMLVAAGIVPEKTIEKALGKFLKARTVGSIELETIDRQVAWLLSPRVVRRFKTVPFRKEGNRLSVVSLEPIDLLVEDELTMLTGCMVTSFIGIEFRVMECLSKLHGFDLSPQLDAIIKKMRGLPSSFTGIAPVMPVEPGRLKTQQPTAPPQVSNAAKVRPTPRPKPKATPPPPPAEPVVPTFTEVDELEMDAEDRALFPTLGDTAAVEDVETVDPQLPAEPLPEPPPAPYVPPPEPPVVEPPPPQPAIAPEPVEEIEKSPEERLAIAANQFQDAEMRDDIADAILEFCAPLLKRRMLLVVRKGNVVGWRGEGDGVDEMAVRAVSIPLDEPSVFVPLTQGTAFWLGALPPMPRNIELVFALGGGEPRDCVILPVKVRDRIVCYLFGDNAEDGVAGVPLGPLRRLTGKAGLAFQVYIMKSKIRLL